MSAMNKPSKGLSAKNCDTFGLRRKSWVNLVNAWKLLKPYMF